MPDARRPSLTDEGSVVPLGVADLDEPQTLQAVEGLLRGAVLAAVHFHDDPDDPAELLVRRGRKDLPLGALAVQLEQVDLLDVVVPQDRRERRAADLDTARAAA